MKRFVVLFILVWISVGVLSGVIYSSITAGIVPSPQNDDPVVLYSEKFND